MRSISTRWESAKRPAFTSAGPHFNPMNKKHGLKNPAGPHAGDLPDMYVEKNGAGRYEVLIDSITLGSGETSIFDADGSTIIIHVTADDNVTDPAGNSGDPDRLRRDCALMPTLRFPACPFGARRVGARHDNSTQSTGSRRRRKLEMTALAPVHCKLGFIGIGSMGRPIARRLLQSWLQGHGLQSRSSAKRKRWLNAVQP